MQELMKKKVAHFPLLNNIAAPHHRILRYLLAR